MPKAPRDNSTTPKKRARKAAADSSNGTHIEHGNGAAQSSVTVSSQPASEVQLSPQLEEQIRLRAYELYLQRGGNGGSPEQDWLQAKEEICGSRSLA